VIDPTIDPDNDPELASAREALRSLPLPETSIRTAVLARIAPKKRSTLPLYGLAMITGFAAALLMIDGEPVPRGDANADQALRVFVADGDSARPITTSERADALLSFSIYRSKRTGPQTMVYAIDAAREVHWFYPAYTDASEPPRSIALSAEGWSLLPEAVRMADVARGPMTFVLLTSDAARDVRDIEAAVTAGKLAPDGTSLTTLTSEIP